MIYTKMLLSLMVLASIACVSCSNQNRNKSLNDVDPANIQYVETFKLEKCDKVVLAYYSKMADQSNGIPPQTTREITDSQTIEEILAFLKELPDKGEIMKKMSEDVPVLNVNLFYGDQVKFFTYYNNTVKTPATSFYAHSPKEEKALYDLLQALLK